MLELYDFNNSVCAQKVRMTLAEKGLDWTEREVDLFRLEQYDPKYLAFNPKGVVPTLVHDGTPVIESTLICEYLDDVFPDPPLRPSGPVELSAMRVWAKTVDEGLHAGITAISFSAMFRERMRGMTDEQRARRWRNIGDPARSDRDRSVYEHGVDSPYVYNAIAAYESAFEKLEKTFAHGGSWSWAMRLPSPTSCSPPTWRGSTTSPCSTSGPWTGRASPAGGRGCGSARPTAPSSAASSRPGWSSR